MEEQSSEISQKRQRVAPLRNMEELRNLCFQQIEIQLNSFLKPKHVKQIISKRMTILRLIRNLKEREEIQNFHTRFTKFIKTALEHEDFNNSQTEAVQYLSSVLKMHQDTKLEQSEFQLLEDQILSETFIKEDLDKFEKMKPEIQEKVIQKKVISKQQNSNCNSAKKKQSHQSQIGKEFLRYCKQEVSIDSNSQYSYQYQPQRVNSNNQAFEQQQIQYQSHEQNSNGSGFNLKSQEQQLQFNQESIIYNQQNNNKMKKSKLYKNIEIPPLSKPEAESVNKKIQSTAKIYLDLLFPEDSEEENEQNNQVQVEQEEEQEEEKQQQ